MSLCNLIDADSLLYRAGFAKGNNEPGKEALCLWQLDQLIQDIADDTGHSNFKLFISGSGNFRYSIYPDYKGQRVNTQRPIHLGAMREHIVSCYGADVSDGIEADDAVGICSQAGGECLISHIDKDLDTLPGKHYNYTKKEYYTISERTAFFNFFKQMLMGDKADNIPGYDGKMRQKIPNFMMPVLAELNDCQGPEEMFDIVLGWYSEDLVKFDLSARCLWIQRKENDDYLQWLNGSIMEEIGRGDALTALLQARSAPQVGDGNQNLSV